MRSKPAIKRICSWAATLLVKSKVDWSNLCNSTLVNNACLRVSVGEKLTKSTMILLAISIKCDEEHKSQSEDQTFLPKKKKKLGSNSLSFLVWLGFALLEPGALGILVNILSHTAPSKSRTTASVSRLITPSSFPFFFLSETRPVITALEALLNEFHYVVWCRWWGIC